MNYRWRNWKSLLLFHFTIIAWFTYSTLHEAVHRLGCICACVCIRISSYLFKWTTNQFNHNILGPYWISFFIGKSESGIWGPWLQTKKFDILPTVAIFVDASKINKKIFFWKIFQGTRNGTFWLSNEKTNCIWTNLEEIGDNCGWFKLLRTYSIIDMCKK